MQDSINTHLKNRIFQLSKYLDWPSLSSNRIITWDIVLDNLDKPWSWFDLSNHPNITWDIVKENLDKPWDWFGLGMNPNILMTDQELCEIVKRIVKARVIQRYWRICVSDPNYLVCRKRLLYEHNNM